MTANAFRQIALSLPEAVESAHMNHPDFRVHGKIFATLGHPDAAHGVVKLTPAQQKALIGSSPGVFTPAAGAWGKRGMTTIRLREADASIVRRAIEQAWCNTAPKALVRERAHGHRSDL